MKKTLILFIGTSIVFHACKNNTTETQQNTPYTIDMAQLFEDAKQTPEFKWNSLAERVDLIPLPQTDRILTWLTVQGLNDEGKALLVSIADGTIAVVDIKTGELVSSFNRVGRAGNEYLMPFSQILNARIYENEIYVHDEALKRLQVYDLSGKYLRSVNIKTDDRISTFDIIDKHTFMLTQVPLPSSDENIIPSNFILMVDDNGDTIRSYFPLKFEHAPIMMQSCDCPFIYDEGVLVSGGHIGNDTMYMITAKEIHPFLITDFGKRGEIRKREFEGVDDVTFDDVYWPFYFGYYKDMLFSRLIYLEKRYTSIWEKDQLLAFKEGGFACDLPGGGSVELYEGTILGNKLIAPVEAHKLVGIVDGVTENDNPFLVIVTLKE